MKESKSRDKIDILGTVAGAFRSLFALLAKLLKWEH